MVSGATRSIGARICAVASAMVLLLLVLVALNNRLEPVEPDRPVFLPLAEPALGLGERLGLKAAEMRAPDLLARDQPGPLEHFHMLRSAGEAHCKRLGERSDRSLAERELRQHPAPRRIGKRVENSIESILNHVVEYRPPGCDCQPCG